MLNGSFCLTVQSFFLSGGGKSSLSQQNKSACAVVQQTLLDTIANVSYVFAIMTLSLCSVAGSTSHFHVKDLVSQITADEAFQYVP